MSYDGMLKKIERKGGLPDEMKKAKEIVDYIHDNIDGDFSYLVSNRMNYFLVNEYMKLNPSNIDGSLIVLRIEFELGSTYVFRRAYTNHTTALEFQEYNYSFDEFWRILKQQERKDNHAQKTDGD